jgi:diadenosine tetraphosphatase ApaH/serine/threonine PP2A family protein phosphatase
VVAGINEFLMLAILSDIHANLEALDAVLRDMARYPVDEIFCLGDIVGYGPDPLRCLDRVMDWEVVLLGNHEAAAIAGGFVDDTVNGGIHLFFRQLDAAGDGFLARQRRLDFLHSLPRRHERGPLLFVHGSARNPLDEYVFPEDIYNQRKLERIFALVGGYCFQGHTHVPGIFTEQVAGQVYHFSSPEEIAYVHVLDDCKTMCNVGSVGQPRDGDWRACYVPLDGRTVHFGRVEYDIDTTIRKIRDLPDLDDFFGDRLGDGL